MKADAGIATYHQFRASGV